mmetsp:Transcript_16254/g.31322  ORF Transcript_16254/g.31322 Transcript_16254/m.31322 type:complete len:238 (+) Transcript_16254:410-1123(+)
MLTGDTSTRGSTRQSHDPTLTSLVASTAPIRPTQKCTSQPRLLRRRTPSWTQHRFRLKIHSCLLLLCWSSIRRCRTRNHPVPMIMPCLLGQICQLNHSMAHQQMRRLVEPLESQPTTMPRQKHSPPQIHVLESLPLNRGSCLQTERPHQPVLLRRPQRALCPPCPVPVFPTRSLPLGRVRKTQPSCMRSITPRISLHLHPKTRSMCPRTRARRWHPRGTRLTTLQGQARVKQLRTCR